jgi:hypothetical protein
MYLVRQGKVVWAYDDPSAKGEISDAVRLSNGNILFAHQFGVTLITPEKKVVWSYDAPAGTEIHTAAPVGAHHVLFIQNGKPAKVIVMDISDSHIVKQFEIPTGNPDKVHPQFRHARLTPAGTLLVAHLDSGRVVEYDAEGKSVWSIADLPGAWAAQRLPDGNTLITSARNFVHEVNPRGETVWAYLPSDTPGYRFGQIQVATRFPNGNTLVNNWGSRLGPTSVQALELSPDKKPVRALRAWSDPTDLGPSTILQILDTPEAIEDAHCGNIH